MIHVVLPRSRSLLAKNTYVAEATPTNLAFIWRREGRSETRRKTEKTAVCFISLLTLDAMSADKGRRGR
jgi:hypothetical protein